MEYSKVVDNLKECHDIIESSLTLLTSDFSYVKDGSSILVNFEGYLHPIIDVNLKDELKRVIFLLEELVK